MPRANPSTRSVTPPSVAQVLPHEIAGSHSFLLQGIYDLKGSFSRVEEKIDTARTAIDKLESEVEAIRMEAASVKGSVRGAAWVISGLIGIAVLLFGIWIAGDLSLKVERGGPPTAVPPVTAVAAPAKT